MIVVLGLGNFKEEYLHTRHNVGFDVTDRIAAFFQKKMKKRCFRNYASVCLPEKDAVLVQPWTFMNNSGKVVRYFPKNAKYVVICDNMDLNCGALRIKQGGGGSGQKGLASVASALGTDDFVRVYVGIGRPDAGVSVNDHVLGREEKNAARLNEALDMAARAVCDLLDGISLEKIKSEYNRK